MAMIAGRLVYAGSKLSLSNRWKDTALWELCGVEGEVDVEEHCYKAMDRLLERQSSIQKILVEKHLRNGSLVLYDITSSYCEGKYQDSEIVTYGYNRDGKRGHEQVVIGLLCSSEGCPVAVEVFAGNTQDAKTLQEKIAEVQKRYGIEEVIFVGNRGMITRANYQKIKDKRGLMMISALTHRQIRELSKRGVLQQELFDEKEIIEVLDPENPGQRYCLCRNPLGAERESKTRKELLEVTRKELDRIAQSRRTTTSQKIAARVGKALGKTRMGKQEIVASYKKLTFVEQAFRNLKTVQLEIRPLYHKTDDRIRCHVFVCMLAYYIQWHMKQRLKPLFASDGKNKYRQWTFESVIERLKSIRLQTLSVAGVECKIVSDPEEDQQKILNYLAIRL
ncbi:MAG: Mobile element protein [Candidatus Jettenia ecosi]|uniref:Mobile element protein n=1 Tax=Candidatus Jettenia ecosi TaxID=2494326 RepID=A0A533QB10_9BACT|nr:MAG: Mobile element protein [Candidatus Jettenia ecosi]